jgi:putative Holliday junction resolvase
MPVKSIQDLKSERRRDSRLLGLDLGSKTIGLGLSDVTLTIASPLETIKRSKFAKDAAWTAPRARAANQRETSQTIFSKK